MKSPESLDLSILGGRIPSTIPDHPSNEPSDDGMPRETRCGPFRNAISNIADRTNTSNRYKRRWSTTNTPNNSGQSLLPSIQPSSTDYPQRGWTEEDYYDQNPWYGQAKEKPLFSLGKPLPHMVRRKRGIPKKTVQGGDEEQGDLKVQQEIPESGIANNEGDVDAASPAARRLSTRTTQSRTPQIASPRGVQHQQSQTTAAGVAHSQKRNDAGQPVFDYVPSKTDHDEQTSEGPPTSRTADLNTDPSYKIDGEPLGQQEQSEVEEGFKDPDEMRNWWARFRAKHPELLAEFLATGVANFMGLAGSLSVNLSSTTSSPYGDYETASWAWGFAWMFGIYLGGGVSGAHMNPCISIALSIFRGFPWKQCGMYIVAQFLGSLVAAALAYGCYADSIRQLDPDKVIMAKSFFSTPQQWVSDGTAFLNQIVGGAIMMIAVFALGDDQNNPPGAGMHALILGFLVTALKFTLGFNTGSALNPASDFGPRLVVHGVGYREHDVLGSMWWLYGIWVGSLLGSMLGCTVYDGCVFVGSESPINYRSSDSTKNRMRALFRPLIKNGKSGDGEPMKEKLRRLYGLLTRDGKGRKGEAI